MVGDRLWLLLPEPVRELPADLAAVVAIVVLTDLSVLLPVVRETPLRVVFGLAFVLFVPGYAFIAALFPEAGSGPTDADADAGVDAPGGHDGGSGADRRDGESGSAGDVGPDGIGEDVPPGAGERGLRDRGIDGIERVALSFGLSIAVVPLIGLVLNFTPWGIRLVPILLAVSGFTLVATAVAAVRRWELPPEERFRAPYRDWLGAAREELLEPETRADAALNLLLVASILLAAGSVGYAVAVPKQGEQFTEFYILTENEEGELVAAGYPTEFERGESRPLVIGIGNHEHRPMNYTVVVALQRVRVANNSTTVLASEELDRLPARVAHNETWQRTYRVTPTMTGERLRLVFLLYRGDAPAEPRVRTAYRELHLWVNVTAPG